MSEYTSYPSVTVKLDECCKKFAVLTIEVAGMMASAMVNANIVMSMSMHAREPIEWLEEMHDIKLESPRQVYPLVRKIAPKPMHVFRKVVRQARSKL